MHGGLRGAEHDAGRDERAQEKSHAADELLSLERRCQQLQRLVGELLLKNQELRLRRITADRTDRMEGTEMYGYRVTLEGTTDQQGNPVADRKIVFEAKNHDDLLGIVERIRARGDFDADTAAALAVGLKLFGEVVLQHRDRELFAEIRPALAEFVKKLKKDNETTGPGAA